MLLTDLQKQLASLETELENAKSSGNYLIGVRIERSPAGGSASKGAKESCKYARLRAGRGKLLQNGKKSLYIPIEKIAEYQAACDRGKQIQQLERQIERIKTQIGMSQRSQYRRWTEKNHQQHKAPKFPRPVTLDNAEVSTVDPPIAPATSAAILVLYRQSPHSPVHAVAAEIWQGNQKVVEVKPMHCMGMRADKVTDYIKVLLVDLNRRYSVLRFEDVVREIPVQQCPLIPCPLKHS